MSDVSLQPCWDLLLVVKDDPGREVAEGIVAPDNHEVPSTCGTVVGVGPEQWEFEAGQRVIFGQFAGTQLKMAMGTYWILQPDEVLGFLPAVIA